MIHHFWCNHLQDQEVIFGRFTESRGMYILGPGEYQVPRHGSGLTSGLSWLCRAMVVWMYWKFQYIYVQMIQISDVSCFCSAHGVPEVTFYGLLQMGFITSKSPTQPTNQAGFHGMSRHVRWVLIPAEVIPFPTWTNSRQELGEEENDVIHQSEPRAAKTEATWWHGDSCHKFRDQWYIDMGLPPKLRLTMSKSSLQFF